MAIENLETIIVVMLENRSFDHMLGYLSLPGANGPANIEGLSADPPWRAKFANKLGATDYEVQPVDMRPGAPVADPPHTHDSIAVQINTAPLGPGETKMGGFVQSYQQYSKSPPPDLSAVMRYHDRRTVPAFDFFARNFCVCDHWFSALPLGTQANRLMAMAGESRLVDNSDLFLPEQPLVYDWLTEHNVPWCAYQAGNFLPFFSLMPKWLPEMGTSLTLSALCGSRGRFRRYDRFKSEWASTKPMPNVIFIEPEYTDGPHGAPNDDHPPTDIGPGQALLLDIYKALTNNPTRWAKTLLIITYDEHGGFFDHVAPLPIRCTIAGQIIPSTGVRVPALLVSPWVEPGSVFKGPLDHTSILELFAERFAPGQGYSIAVNARQGSLGRISAALRTVPASASSKPPSQKLQAALAKPAGKPEAQRVRAPAPEFATPNAAALDKAVRKFANDHPDLVQEPVWSDLRKYVRSVPGPATP